jgi:hypothetical protein
VRELVRTFALCTSAGVAGGDGTGAAETGDRSAFDDTGSPLVPFRRRCIGLMSPCHHGRLFISELCLALAHLLPAFYDRRMLTHPASLVIPVLLLGVSGCSSYDPPIHGDHTLEKYQTDLKTCRTSSAETVRRHNAGAPGTWIMSPINGPPEVRAAIRTCMTGKGYVLEKAGD